MGGSLALWSAPLNGASCDSTAKGRGWRFPPARVCAKHVAFWRSCRETIRRFGPKLASWHDKNLERTLRSVHAKSHVSSICLYAFRMWLSTGIYSINRGSDWLWLANQEAPENRQNMQGFQVGTPICHVVLVSHTNPKPPAGSEAQLRICGKRVSKGQNAYHWGQNDHLPNLYSRRIILGNLPCALCVQTRISRGAHAELLDKNYLT